MVWQLINGGQPGVSCKALNQKDFLNDRHGTFLVKS